MSASDTPLDKTIEWVNEGKRLAIVVGVNNSSVTPLNWKKLHFAEKDAEEVAHHLKQEACNFQLVKPPLIGKGATADNIRKAIVDLVKERTKDDFLLFYFSGHAQPMPINDDIYFVTDDFNKDNVKIDNEGYISMRLLHKLLYQSVGAGCVLLILDCCYAGNMAEAKNDLLHETFQTLLERWDKAPADKEQQNLTRAILAATGYDIKAIEKDEYGHGLMTEFLLHTINEGKARQYKAYNVKGEITITSLSDYVQINVPRERIATLSGKFTKQWIIANYPDLSTSHFKKAQQDREDKIIEEIRKIQPHSPLLSDYSICFEATIDDLDIEKVANFFKKDKVQKELRAHKDFRPDASYQEQLELLELLQETHPSYAALLCFGRKPRKWITNAYTRCIEWGHNDRHKGWRHDGGESKEGLLNQFEDSLTFLIQRLDSRRDIDEKSSTDRLEIPSRVLQEALTNALVHREYLGRKDSIAVEVFNDRIEISSPGGPPEHVDIKHLLEDHGSHLRNEQIARIFNLYNYVEKFGTGIPRIQHEMNEAGLPDPVFTLTKDKRFKVTLFRPAPEEFSMFSTPMDIAVLPLPPAVSGLVGREEDQKWLESCIGAGKIVGVSGMAGVGKTTLVANTVNKVWSQFRNGGVAVILADNVTDPKIIFRQLVEKFVPNRQELLSRLDTKPNMLNKELSDILSMHHDKGNPILIVIDGIEPKLVEDEKLEELINIFRSTKTSVVITGRARLSTGLVQESLELNVFTDEAACHLLSSLLEGSLHRPLNDVERQDAASICELVGNHAQAIVLIAAYFEYHPQTSLASYLQQMTNSHSIALDLTNRLRPIGASRGIRLTFASSYAQLEESAQRLFIGLGALPDRGGTYQAVQALGSALGFSEEETRTGLETCIRSKLVLISSTDASGNVKHIHLHPLLQEFARELLRISPDISEETLFEVLASYNVE